jgi:two-component system sensor histidine kinase GlrK
MNENGSRLQRMIEDLLRAQQASLAVAGISPQIVRLDQICKQVMKEHQLLAEKHQIRLWSELPEVSLEAVADNLHKVVDNLLSNAIKFSPEGSRVRLRLQTDETSLTLTISDEGPGFLEHEKEFVFEPFFRGSITRSKGVEGSGVGLAISRDFVAAHRGTLTILPVPRGACLEVRLPLRQPHKEANEPAHA